MNERGILYERVSFELPCTITRRGHEVPIPRGVFVKCVYDSLSIDLIADLNENGFVSRERRAPAPRLRMKDAGVGSIIEQRWHVCSLELCRSKIHPPSYDYDLMEPVSARLDEVFEDLYYYVAFKAGMFWTRFDWIEVVKEPA